MTSCKSWLYSIQARRRGTYQIISSYVITSYSTKYVWDTSKGTQGGSGYSTVPRVPAFNTYVDFSAPETPYQPPS